MLYSVPILLDKEYRVKVGLREVKRLQEQDIDPNTKDISVIIDIIAICLKIENNGKLESVNITSDELIDLIDNSEYSIDETVDIFEQAIDLGIYKGKKEKKT